MATAINFNWNHSKMVNGKVYDFIFNGSAMTCKKDNGKFIVNDSAVVDIFREGATVLDLLALTIKKAGRLTSGEVYKANLLTWESEDYTKDAIYTGINCPSTSFINNMPKAESAYFYGFELEVSCRNTEAYAALRNGFMSNVVRMVSDSSINGHGIEYTSTLISPVDAVNPKFYEPLCDILTGLAKSRTDSSTGLHFHISRTAFGATPEEQMENIAKVIYMENYILNQSALAELFGRPAGGRWTGANITKSDLAKKVNEVAKIAGAKFINEELAKAMTDDLTPYNAIRRGHNYPSERYQRINITNPHTVEFRQGKGDINSKSMARIAQHIETLVKYCKSSKWGRLSESGYISSIPSSNKYDILRACFQIAE